MSQQTVGYIDKIAEAGDTFDSLALAAYNEETMLAPSKLSTAGPAGAYEYWAKTADPSISDVKVVSDIETLSKTLSVSSSKAYMRLTRRTRTTCATSTPMAL